jgi:GH15 family glucan-1,4-alpha-glucosidase
MVNVAAGSENGLLQPVYRIDGRSVPDELEAASLPGYRGMGPVRVGNQAYRQVQNDVYGSAVLAATHVFFDRRLARAGDAKLFERLEPLGNKALEVFDQPDAGLWERRGASRVHAFSSIMCWAACDRLSKIAQRLGVLARADYWSGAAQRIHRFVCERMWSDKRKAFVAAAQGEELDASMLLLQELGFLRADDPRFASTVRAIEGSLKQGDFVYRYVEQDDFGVPSNAFLVCTYWYINALAALGRMDDARGLFEKLLASGNRHGLLAEHIDPVSGEHWGNFPQTYSMVGLINSAIRLSKPWDQAF